MRWKTAMILAVVLGTAFTGLVAATAGAQRDPLPKGSSSFELRSANGPAIGTMTLTPQRRSVLVSIGVRGLTPGYHGFHVHAIARCDRLAVDAAGQPTPFSTAGPHFNPDMVAHGQHRGDFPPLLVGRAGTASATFPTDRFTIGQLLDADGSAAIVHANPDNEANIPGRYVGPEGPGPDGATRETGDSGDRVACGVVKRPRR